MIMANRSGGWPTIHGAGLLRVVRSEGLDRTLEEGLTRVSAAVRGVLRPRGRPRIAHHLEHRIELPDQAADRPVMLHRLGCIGHLVDEESGERRRTSGTFAGPPRRPRAGGGRSCCQRRRAPRPPDRRSTSTTATYLGSCRFPGPLATVTITSSGIDRAASASRAAIPPGDHRPGRSRRGRGGSSRRSRPAPGRCPHRTPGR